MDRIKSLELQSIPDLLREASRMWPESIALVGQSASGGRTSVSFREIDLVSDSVASALRALGLSRGDRVGLLMTNEAIHEAHLAYHGVLKSGGVNVPLNARYRATEIQELVVRASVTFFIFESRFLALVDALRNDLPDMTWICVGTRVGWALPFGDLLDASPESSAGPNKTDDANWIFTSGTTGPPKAVALTHGGALACAHQVSDAWGFGPGDVYHSPSPFFSSTGIHTNLLSCLCSGVTLIVDPSFDVDRVLRAPSEDGVTVALWLTPMLKLMLDSGQCDDAEIGGLRRILYGGQAMPPAFHLVVDETFGERFDIELVHMIGQTEAGPGGIILEPEYHRSKPGSVGNRSFSEILEWTVLNDEGSAVDPGGVGELCFRGPAVMRGYAGDVRDETEVFSHGWMHGGDLVRLDEDGFAFFVDRRKDVIRRGGLSISASEVEEVLYAYPGVREAAAVPMYHPVLGEVVKAVVVVEGQGFDPDRLIAFCSERLADFKVPRAVEVRDELPRNPMGKIQKHLLREGPK